MLLVNADLLGKVVISKGIIVFWSTENGTQQNGETGPKTLTDATKTIVRGQRHHRGWLKMVHPATSMSRKAKQTSEAICLLQCFSDCF